MRNNDEDLFKPESFGEKIRSRTSDILFILLISVTVFAVVQTRKSGNSEQCIQNNPQIQRIYNDSINQNIR